MAHLRFWIETTFGSSPFGCLITLAAFVFLWAVIAGW
jgi:hypothetical protein